MRPGSPGSSSAPNSPLDQRAHPPTGQEDGVPSLRPPSCLGLAPPSFCAAFLHPVSCCIYLREGQGHSASEKLSLFTTANGQKMPLNTVLSTHFKNNFMVEIMIPFMFSRPALEERESSILLSHLIPCLR